MNKFKSDNEKASPDKGTKNRLTLSQLSLSPQGKKSLGIAAIMGSVFLLLAFLSFLGSFKADFAIVQQIKHGYITSISDNLPSNWMGVTGAYLAYKFVYSWFGITAFIFPIALLFIGLQLSFDVKIPHKNKLVNSSLFLLFWLPLSISLMAKGKYDFIAGGYGVNGMLWLKQLMGAPGLVLILASSLLIFLLLVLKIDLLNKLSQPKDQVAGETVSAPIASPSTVKPTPERESPVEKMSPIHDRTYDFAVSHGQGTNANENDYIDEDNLESPQGTDFEIEDLRDRKDLEMELSERPKEEHFDTLVHADGDYDPTLDLSNYHYPGLDLLKEYTQKEPTISKSDLEERKNLIVDTLGHYKIEISQVKATIGPTVTLFEIVPAKGVRISKIKNLEDDIALSLAALGIRIIAPIPGKGTVGIEVPNVKPEIVSMHDVISSAKFQTAEMELPIAFGRTISNEVFVTDLTKMPHLLMAGATGQGKSVGLNVIIASILYKKHPAQVKFVMVDPKKVELSLYKIIERHFLAKLPDEEESIITDTSKVINTLNSLCIEMDHRYDMLKEAQVRTIKEYNQKFLQRRLSPQKGHKFMPYIVLIIDELADLMMTAGKEVEMPIARLAQLARAIGIHLVVATQRPSVNIITGIIKANFPARLAFRVTSKVDSRTILDTGGADQLIGRGDMLFTTGGDLLRIQCAFLDTPEVDAVCAFIGEQRGYPTAFLLPEAPNEGGGTDLNGDMDEGELDPLFEDAARCVVQNQVGSTSLLQRRLKLGYNRAGRLMDQLERTGVVGAHEGSKAREVLIPDEYALEQFLTNLRNKK
jgi:S-DNA-T family DNA segregation ATPase FtsK/SpoIIIE